MTEINENQSIEQTILETAERLFLEKGFESTSTTKIAKEVGCNQALIHYYYRTKENLFNRIFENKFRMIFQQLFSTENMSHLGFSEKIRYIALAHFELLEKNPRIPYLILNELSRQPAQMKLLREKLRSYTEKAFKDLNTDLQQEIAAGKIRNCSLSDIIISMVSLNVSLFLMMPVVEQILMLDEKQKKALIQHRKEENINFLLAGLRP
jgi:AcrR family transcriptional regulator